MAFLKDISKLKVVRALSLVALLGLSSASASAKTEKRQHAIHTWIGYKYGGIADPYDYKRTLAMVVSGDERYDIGCETRIDALGVNETTCYIDGGQFGNIDGFVDAVYEGLPNDVGQNDFFGRCLEANSFDYRSCVVPFEQVENHSAGQAQVGYDSLLNVFDQGKQKNNGQENRAAKPLPPIVSR